ncbi:hypothetical protein INS49_001491 [Diaporthe citri]|uniref:uncharacterized protein n=1 Tax=Diaporthe citri TaxID=83186 RepID=UPI001C80DA97|nr:uncharacterized protein INS49_001491 [Diaporthe citri]KAG6367304.1 hypothetical protein INS49_001491 [Diaporthe citri]
MSHSPPFTTSVANKSGTVQSYAVFSEAPTIRSSGSSPGISKISTIRIITSVKGVSSGQGIGYFTLSKKLYAICGTYDVDGHEERLPAGTGAEVIDYKLVTSGKIDATGKAIGGTLLEVDSSEGSPAFVKGYEQEPVAEADCFVIRTRSEFTSQEAKQISMRRTIGFHATFVPGPNQTYQIEPSKVFHVAIGSYNARNIVKKSLRTATATFRVDFEELGTDDVQLVHGERGNLQRLVIEGAEEE